MLSAIALAGCIDGPEEPATSAIDGDLLVDTTATLWTSNGNTIPVCFMARGWTRYKDWIRNDVRRSWQRVANVNFTGWGDCPTTGSQLFVKVDIIAATCPDCDNGGDGQSDGLGMSNLHAPWQGSSVRFWLRSPDGSAARNRVAYLAVHEFGHVLGFMHEQDSRDNVVTRPDYCNQTSGPLPQGEQVSPYDLNSIMNYCNAYNNDQGMLTPGDIAGVRAIYGPRPVDIFDRSDLVWIDSVSRQISLWQMTWNAGIQNYVYPGWLGTDQIITGIGDFNGDGNGDLVIRNQMNGALAIWSLKGGSFWRSDDLGTVDPAWQVVGVGDFDGDGVSDLLWRNRVTRDVGIWQMNDTFHERTRETVQQAVPANWQMFGVGDFDGDGRSDVLWRDANTGQVGIWRMDAHPGDPPTTFIAEYTYPAGSVPAEWTIAGVGDFDGDGHSDLLWRNTANGAVGIWLMANAWSVKQFVTTAPGSLAWRIDSVGDYNTDGRADIAWRNTQTGDVGIWLMNGGTVQQYVTPQSNVPVEWQIRGSLLDPSF